MVRHSQHAGVQRNVMIGGAWLATNNKNSETTLHHAKRMDIIKDGVLTRDGGILGELANDFANFRGYKRLPRQR